MYCYKSVIHDDKPSKFSENPERLITGQPPRLFTDQQAKAHKFKSIVSEQFYTQSIIRNMFWNRNEDLIQDKNSCVKHGDSTWGMIVPFAPQRNCSLKNMNCPPTLSSPFKKIFDDHHHPLPSWPGVAAGLYAFGLPVSCRVRRHTPEDCHL